jgi:RND family efflux transporter MFP subunit
MSWFRQYKTVTFSLSGLLALLVLAALVYILHFHGSVNSAGAQEDGATASGEHQVAPLRVKVVHPKEGGVERLVRRPATVQAFDFADLYAKVSGYLENQQVDIGSKVKKDDVLASVYAPELHKNVEKASADLTKARASAKAAAARVSKAEADLESARSQYEQARADVQKAQAMLELRKKQYVRYKNLYEAKSIQLELVDEKQEAQYAAESTLNASEKAVQTARSGVVAARAGVEQARADLADAQAAIDVARAELDRAEVWARYTRITSPYTGVVTKRNFHNGDFIRDASRTGELPILAVGRTDKMRVIVEVPDRAVPYLKVDDPATLLVDTLPERHFKGKVARMAYLEAYDTRTMRTEVDMPNPDNLLKDGMYGAITIHLGREEGLRVPSKCLVGNEKGEDRSVFVVRDGQAREVKVRIGIDDGIEATVRDGLSTSDQVVAERRPALADGSHVELISGTTHRADAEEKVKP